MTLPEFPSRKFAAEGAHELSLNSSTESLGRGPSQFLQWRGGMFALWLTNPSLGHYIIYIIQIK